MKEPLISVLVAVYNVETYVERCILSLINQTYQNIEIILVDDGSKDSSGILCDNFALIDNRIRVVHTENNGLSGARNVGLDNAMGDYIVFVDGDDDVLNNLVEAMYNCATEFDADIVIIGRTNIYNTKPPLTVIHYPETGLLGLDVVMQDLFDDKLGSQAWEKFYKRKLWEGIRFIPGIVYAEDVAIVHKVYHNAHRIASLPIALYNYYINDSSLTTTYRPFKWISTYLAFKNRLEFAKVYYPSMTEKLEGITLNFARLALDNFFQRREECDITYIPEIIERIQNSKKKIVRIKGIKWKNKLMMLFFNFSPKLYEQSIGLIHRIYYKLNPNKFR